ncbi:hypothetical protein IAR55_006587 [Kwoniella newhampshirensis]|uniref:Extracellular membrane protein CFEM domain-containing protein n=1 Tax=Kwoniella newhampshirensis TaxID=1651941 RepID=A0AAW0YTG8_9TREE
MFPPPRRLRHGSLILVTAILISASVCAETPPTAPSQLHPSLPTDSIEWKRALPPPGYDDDQGGGGGGGGGDDRPAALIATTSISSQDRPDLTLSFLTTDIATPSNKSPVSQSTSNASLPFPTYIPANATTCTSERGGCTVYLNSISNCTNPTCACLLTLPAQVCAECIVLQQDEKARNETVKTYNDYLEACEEGRVNVTKTETLSGVATITGTVSEAQKQGGTSASGKSPSATMTATEKSQGDRSSSPTVQSTLMTSTSSSSQSMSLSSSQSQSSPSPSSTSNPSSDSSIFGTTPSSRTTPTSVFSTSSASQSNGPPDSSPSVGVVAIEVTASIASITSDPESESQSQVTITSTRHVHPSSGPDPGGMMAIATDSSPNSNSNSTSDPSGASPSSDSSSDNDDVRVYTSYSTVGATPSSSPSSLDLLLTASAATTLGMMYTSSDSNDSHMDQDGSSNITSSNDSALDASKRFFASGISQDCTSDCQVWKSLAQSCKDDKCICADDALTSASSCSDCIGKEAHGSSYVPQMSAYSSFASNCSASDSSSVPTGGGTPIGGENRGGIGFAPTSSANPFEAYGSSSSTNTITATVEAAEGVVTSSRSSGVIVRGGSSLVPIWAVVILTTGLGMVARWAVAL